MLAVIGSSLLLSFGIGMLSGGLQHFDEFPVDLERPRGPMEPWLPLRLIKTVAGP
ncbi:hypothetical protein [Streptomyces virginiae]|uniref:hypothetical protein n=1 Tax=Streptomyces virginiae TaxID=1961 RepID=UPI0036F806B8